MPDDSLDDFPKAFADDERMPWEVDVPKPTWPWGWDRGTELEAYPSAMLVKRREQMAELIRVIDEILTERAGE